MANLKSAIWKNFKVCEKDKNKAICILCSSESSQKYIVRGKSLKSHSTTPLWNHLQFKHPDIYGKMKNVGHSSKTNLDDPPKISQKEDKSVQKTLESTLLKRKIWSLDDSRSKAITSKICKLMALDAEPFSVVEREGFSQLLEHLAPCYPLPSRTYFKNKALPELYEKLQQFILQDLKLAAYISFTTDIWTSSINNESFISLTAHFIEGTEMKQRICTLNCKHFPEKHTGINISDILNEIFEDWKISPAQQHIIVRDNAANIMLATEFDIPCFISNNCSNITGNVICDTQTGKCSCAEGHVRMKKHHHCLPFAGIGELCQVDDQCRELDRNVICSKWSQRCQCTAGYERKIHETINNTNLCLKAPVAEVEPYFVHIFSDLDTVHIVLGCFTGGLALLACFAGILQLVRKKWNRQGCSNERDSQFSPELGFSTTSAPSQSQPYSDSQFSITSPCLGDFACLDGNSTAPPTPGTIGDEDYVVTPPPTYEEALKQSCVRNAGSTTTV